MTERLVCDASALLALLLDSGPDGQWVERRISGAALAAPTLVDFEVSNVIRRHELARVVSPDQAVQAHADLMDLTIERWPFELLGPRVWELRRNLSSYDASYIALAERLGAALITLDARLSRAPGPRCVIDTPP